MLMKPLITLVNCIYLFIPDILQNRVKHVKEDTIKLRLFNTESHGVFDFRAGQKDSKVAMLEKSEV